MTFGRIILTTMNQLLASKLFVHPATQMKMQVYSSKQRKESTHSPICDGCLISNQKRTRWLKIIMALQSLLNWC